VLVGDVAGECGGPSDVVARPGITASTDGPLVASDGGRALTTLTRDLGRGMLA
jgi:hypothetical protein